MYPLRIRFSLLSISLLLLVGSSFVSGKESELPKQDSSLLAFAPLPALETPLLFKASIKLGKSFYSGLFLIKEMQDDSLIHVVFLSELGLNLLDLAYRDGEFEVISVKEFLNRRPIIRTLQNDFRCLLLDLSSIEDYTIKSKKDGVSHELKFRYKSQRYIYHIKEAGAPVQIKRSKGIFSKSHIIMGENKEALTIVISHRGIRLFIELRELERL